MAKKDFQQTLQELKITDSKGVLKYPLIETHCHLDTLKTHSTDELLQRAKELGVEKIITISVGPENFQNVLDLASKYEMVFGTQGIHPHEAAKIVDEDYKKVESGLSHPKIIAVGEIGLDYHYNFSPREKQIACFEKQLQMACDQDLPVVIHTRKADEDTKAIIKNFSPRLRQKGVFHSFTSSIELAELALDLGFYIGFNGIISFKNAQDVRKTLEMTPLDHILLETDAPYLTPMPHRGKENSPLYLPFVAQCVCDVKNIDPDQLCHVVYENSNKLFRLP